MKLVFLNVTVVAVEKVLAIRIILESKAILEVLNKDKENKNKN